MRINLGDDEQPEIGLIALIDCIFFLLMFFMVATSFKQPTDVKKQVELPVELPIPKPKNAWRFLRKWCMPRDCITADMNTFICPNITPRRQRNTALAIKTSSRKQVAPRSAAASAWPNRRAHVICLSQVRKPCQADKVETDGRTAVNALQIG